MINSPTFTILKDYKQEGGAPFHHIDAYRLEGKCQDLGFEDCFDEGITVVEWSEFIEDQLPQDHIKISFEEGIDENRTVTLEYTGPVSKVLWRHIMISLCMDSAYKALVLGLYKDGTLIDGVSIEAFKKQSETIFVELNQLFEKTGLDYKDVDEVIITDGPGSYTGIRIAMTIAKVFCTQMHKTLKCISTMQLFAGMDESANVILDARSKRAYVAHLEKGVVVGETQILEVDQLEDFLNEHPGTLYGDGYLVNQEAASCDFLKNFMEVASRTIENVHALVPQYLKESDAYKA